VPLTICFQPIRLGNHCDGEDALLGLVDDHLVAILVRVADDELPADRQGWFLEAGFGPCRGEGLLFPELKAGETWIRQQIPANWPAGETTICEALSSNSSHVKYAVCHAAR
jgi:hypothetical protein